jgi:hypothetical protein
VRLRPDPVDHFPGHRLQYYLRHQLAETYDGYGAGIGVKDITKTHLFEILRHGQIKPLVRPGALDHPDFVPLVFCRIRCPSIMKQIQILVIKLRELSLTHIGLKIRSSLQQLARGWRIPAHKKSAEIVRIGDRPIRRESQQVGWR